MSGEHTLTTLESDVIALDESMREAETILKKYDLDILPVPVVDMKKGQDFTRFGEANQLFHKYTPELALSEHDIRCEEISKRFVYLTRIPPCPTSLSFDTPEAEAAFVSRQVQAKLKKAITEVVGPSTFFLIYYPCPLSAPQYSGDKSVAIIAFSDTAGMGRMYQKDVIYEGSPLLVVVPENEKNTRQRRKKS